MFFVHHADQLSPLLDSLARVLARPLDDPFASELVVVPAVGMHDAVMAGLGRRLGVSDPALGDGIVANVEFIFPGRFIGRALSRDDGTDDPWSIDRLTWAVLDELTIGGVEVPGPRAGGESWSLARRIADLCDRYATQRPRLIASWAAGVDTDGTLDERGEAAPLAPQHRWQAALWRAVRQRIDVESPAERLGSVLAGVRAGSLHDSIPERVCLFGVGGVAPTTISVLRSLSAVRDVHVFVRHPSPAAWRRSGVALAGGLQPRATCDVAATVTHPLLASWGRPSLEARALIAEVAGVVEVDESVPATGPPATVLGALQQGVRLDATPELVEHLDAADGSLQVHACHGEIRQLEVLRDALGHAFVADPTLAAHDVLVLCPDLERFAALVEPVFARGVLPVPVRIGDRSLATADPLVASLHALLTLVTGRATLSELLGLVQFEPVRRRFGLTIDDVEQIAEWCEEVGTRWGLMSDHRLPWGLPADIRTGTWRAMVDRLLAGIAMPAPTPRVVLDRVVPFDDLGSDDVRVVGVLADLLARLVELHDAVRDARPVQAWVELLHRMLDDFCAVPADESWRMQAVHRDLDAMVMSADGAAGAGGACTVPLTMIDVRALLSDGLRDHPGQVRLRTGAVTVTTLIPQHGVPARVICLLGLDDGSLRGGTFDGDDILGMHPCVGERHPRFESRQLLLDALLAAGDRVIITCNGADITTNNAVPLTVPLVELLDVVADLVPLDEHRSPIVVRHPRHGFNERVLVPGGLIAGSTTSFTFDPAMLAAAEARRGVVERSDADRSTWSLPAHPLPRVDIAALASGVQNVARVYLRDRLEVRVPGDADRLVEALPVKAEPLEMSALGRDLLDATRRGIDESAWTEATRLTGTLPPGDLSTAVLESVRKEVRQIADRAATFGVALLGEHERTVSHELEVEVDHAVRVVRIDGVVRGLLTDRDDPCVVDVRFSRPKPVMRLGLALQLAVLQLDDPERDWAGVLVCRAAATGKAPEGVRLRIAGSGDSRRRHAEALLGMAVQLFEWAQRDAVPFFPQVSTPLSVDDLGGADANIDADLRDASVSMLWPSLSLEQLLADPIQPTDPEALQTHAPAGGSRAVATARWVWSTYRDAVVEEP
ncbi:MAG: exodeoxyribonuclease V subunit gamma [Ilumatobacteraceae bacterium]